MQGGPNDGLIGPYCSDPPRPVDGETEYYVASHTLHDEITCDPCRALVGLGPVESSNPSRGGLLHDNIAVRLNVFHMFVDAASWNHHNPHEDPINPDDDGELASLFADVTAKFQSLMRPIEKFMEEHEGKYGWADIVEHIEGGSNAA